MTDKPVSQPAEHPELWWQKGIIYQVYPRSYADSNSDGVGDLNGIISKLDYLKWLGVDAVWLSPIYPSPMADFGYDVADYCNVHPMFGTLDDFDELVNQAHKRGLRVILDFVPNHSSDQHPWFLESRSSRDNPKRDWYLWRDPQPDGSPPTNWRSTFGGSGWEFDEATGQYYYHAFLKAQPDLNWRNPEVEEAMHNVLRFWMERGVDGFRVDVLWHIIKDDEWRDNPPNPHYNPEYDPTYNQLDPIYTTDRPEVHDIVLRLRSLVESYGKDRLLIGEIYLPTERLMAYYGPDANGAHMPYNFQLALLNWDSDAIMQAVDRYESLLPENAWPNWVLGNHDQPRIGSRVEPYQRRAAQLLLLTLRGTPTMYYGDELGMLNVPIAPKQVRDPFELQEPGKGNGRDPERTPMPWNHGPGAGFTTSDDPWLPIGENINCNVEDQQHDTDSLLNLVRTLIQLRRKHRALSVGSYQALPSKAPVAAYTRIMDDEHIYVLINFAADPQEYPLPHETMLCILSTDPERHIPAAINNQILLGPGEGVLLVVEEQEQN